jgi:hypothetical protein
MSDNSSPGGFNEMRHGADATGTTHEAGAPAPEAPVSDAVARFRSCRWRRPPEDNGGIECCGHRDVLPLAGSTSFDPEAWCPDCGFYKLRRTPKKREYPY